MRRAARACGAACGAGVLRGVGVRGVGVRCGVGVWWLLWGLRCETVLEQWSSRTVGVGCVGTCVAFWWGHGGAGELGRFGDYGGRFVPESLIPACAELEEAFRDAWADPRFRRDLDRLLTVYAGRPTALTPAWRLSAELGINVLLKREDLAHTGSHKINNVLGQALLAQRMGKTRLLAETGPGSTVWLPRPPVRCSGSESRSTWERKTSSGRRSTSIG